MKPKKSVPKVSLAQRRKLLKSLQNNAAPDALQNSQRLSIVIDTSVLISGLFWRGPENLILKHIFANHSVVLSHYIIDELLDFCRSAMPKVSRKTQREIQQVLERFVYDDNYGNKTYSIRDIKDEPIIKLAIQYEAVVVSSDSDFLAYNDSMPQVLSPQEYNELFMKKLWQLNPKPH